MNAKTQIMQTMLFGPPEPVTSYPRIGRGADLPVPSERELLWPASLVHAMSETMEMRGRTAEDVAALLERVYGDIPRRTRLRVREVCRRLRCDNNKVYSLIENGTLPAIKGGTWLVYRSGLVAYLAWHEFGSAATTRTDVLAEDADVLCRAVAKMRRNRIVDVEN